jgi:putative phosphonate metabolism protein
MTAGGVSPVDAPFGARVALYYVPEADDPLAIAGARWLGRDAETGSAVSQPAIDGIAEVTADPRVYGFHATLKPPMRLADGASWAELERAADELAASVAPFDLPPLTVADVHGFLALRETVPCPALQALADLCVAGMDAFRAPPGAEELARRRCGGLSAAQDGLLRRWGYPYVFGAWFFHLTLTRRLQVDERARWREAAEAQFAPALGVPRRVSAICLSTQIGPGYPFRLATRLTLRG